MEGVYRTTTLMVHSNTFLTPAVSGALALLTGETQGFAIDATTYDTITPAAYVGGPVGGTVAVIDAGTPANNLSNVALDNSNLVQSGTSPKIVQWNDGTLRWAPHNLQPQSQTFDNVPEWTGGSFNITANNTTAPDGTVTADLITATGSGCQIRGTTRPNLANVVFTLSCYGKYNGNGQFFTVAMSDATTNEGGGFFNLNTGVTAGTYTIGTATIISTSMTNAGNGWYRCSITLSIPSTNGGVKLAISDTAVVNGSINGNNLWIWGAQMNRGYSATPYLVTTTARIGIPQEFDIATNQFGFVCERSVTNLVLQSQDFSATWAQTDTTRTSTNNTAPDTSATATLMTEGSAGTAVTSQAITLAVADTHTISLFLKSGNASFVRIGFYETATPTNRADCWFNISTGALGTPATGGTASLASGSIQNTGNGWYRCVLTANVGNSATATTVDFSSASADGSTTRVSGATYYAWGGQAEHEPVVSSYIPTVAATVVRVRDIINVPVSKFPFSQTVGSIYCSGLEYTHDDTNKWYVLFQDSNNRINLELGINSWTFVGSVLQWNLTVGTQADGVPKKSSVAYQANNIAFSVNGSAPTTSASGSVPPAVTTLYLGTNNVSGEDLTGDLFKFVYVPRRVSNTDLPTWRFS